MKNTHETNMPVFPSMTACASACGIPLAVLRTAKRAGCPAFDAANRIHLSALLPWLFKDDRANDENTDWHARWKRAQALAAEADLEERKGQLVSREWVAGCIQRIAGEMNTFRIESEQNDPVRLAAAIGDIPANRQVLRTVWHEIISKIQSLSRHFEEPTTNKNTDENKNEK